MHRRPNRGWAAALAATLAVACVSVSEPEFPAILEFGQPTLDLSSGLEGVIEVRNAGGQAIGPVDFVLGAIQDAGGSTVPGTRLTTDPTEIPTLNPGAASLVTVGVALDGTLGPGDYDAVVTARGGLEASVQLVVRFTVVDEAAQSAAALSVSPSQTQARTGDVVALAVDARDASGALLQGVQVGWTVSPAGAGFVSASGHFVGYEPGAATLTATVGALSDEAVIEVTDRSLSGDFSVVGRAREVARHTSDLWLHGSVAYAGTWGSRAAESGVLFGNALNVWNVADPAAPTRVFSMEVDARTVNDVKVRGDGTLGVVTHEGSADGKNGVTLLDLSAPEVPVAIGRFSQQLESGVHNAWIDGDFAYLVVDGVGNGLRILDIADPAAPQLVASFYAGTSFLHDVYVRDGLAFLSHWNAGLIILDVGHGIAGGSPSNPVEVSRLPDLGGQTHNAWYWPATGYVFVGEEDFGSPGVMHIVDVRNLRAPREVATYAVPGQTPHNFWLDERTGTAYLAWYGNGLRALDVTGDLLGALDRQGREIAGFRYNGGTGSCNRGSADTCTWAPQLHDGVVWVSDMNEGLIALRPPR